MFECEKFDVISLDKDLGEGEKKEMNFCCVK